MLLQSRLLPGCRPRVPGARHHVTRLAPPPAATGSGRPRKRSSSRESGEDLPVVGGGSGDAPELPPPPATQLADSLAAGGSSGSAPGPSPAAQVADNLAAGQPAPQQQQQQPATPADLLNQGIRAAADTAEGLIGGAAGGAVAGIEAASNLTQQDITAAEAAAEETVRGLNTAAQDTLNAAAAAVGGAAGAVDGVASAAATPSGGSSSRRRAGGAGSATSSADFDSVSVRVPAMAWANATPAKGRPRDVTLTQDFDEDEVERLKVEILAAVASLDRGLAANLREAREVSSLAQRLEDAAGAVDLKWSTSRSSPDASTMDKLGGTWRLIYSSGFNGGSLGGRRPGPPAALVPTILGQVYQVIDAQGMRLDNVVELLAAYGLPQLPWDTSEPQPTPGLRVSLHHSYEVSPPSSIRIVFESTSAKAIGPDVLQNLPDVGLPQLPDFLKPPKDLRSATFNVTYLDQSMRITRGDRGELRIYLRDKPLEPSLPRDNGDRDYE